MIFLLDNYDSFVYNLYQMLLGMDHEVEVARNDRFDIDRTLEKKPSCIVLSPGPGRPAASGKMPELIARACERKVPLFGVCLGMQGIGEHFGARVVNAARLMHGKTAKISHDGQGVFKGLEPRLTVMRYHSLALDKLPEELIPTSTSDDGEVMGVRHSTLPVEGVQFHPESFATASGAQMMENFLSQHGCRQADQQ